MVSTTWSSIRPRTKHTPRWPSRSLHARGQTSHWIRPSSSRCQYRVGIVWGSVRLMSAAIGQPPGSPVHAAGISVVACPAATAGRAGRPVAGVDPSDEEANMKILGVDIGGSGVKGAVVDTRKGVFVTDRLRLATPRPATPEAVAGVGRPDRRPPRLARAGRRHLPRRGQPRHRSARPPTWTRPGSASTPPRCSPTSSSGPVAVLNDADAAGVAEQAFGAARKVAGTVVVVTLGTGIGTALINDGRLVPNLELGHIELRRRRRRALRRRGRSASARGCPMRSGPPA